MKDNLAQLFVFAAVYFTLASVAGAALVSPSTFQQQEKPGSSGGTSRPGSSTPVGSEAGSSNPPGSEAGASQHPLTGGKGGHSKPGGKSHKRSVLKEGPIIVLNSGDEQDLKKILGLSPQDAQLIKDNRPYEDMSEVKKILSVKSYQQLVSRIKTNQAAN